MMDYLSGYLITICDDMFDSQFCDPMKPATF